MAYFGIFLDTFEYIGGSGSSLNIHAGCVGDVDRIDSFRSIAAGAGYIQTLEALQQRQILLQTGFSFAHFFCFRFSHF